MPTNEEIGAAVRLLASLFTPGVAPTSDAPAAATPRSTSASATPAPKASPGRPASSPPPPVQPPSAGSAESSIITSDQITKAVLGLAAAKGKVAAKEVLADFVTAEGEVVERASMAQEADYPAILAAIEEASK